MAQAEEAEELIEQEKEEKNEGEKPEKKTSWFPKDYEHAGVAIAIKKKLLKDVAEVREINGRLMSLALKTGGGKIKFIAAYAPTAGKDIETQIDVYNRINEGD